MNNSSEGLPIESSAEQMTEGALFLQEMLKKDNVTVALFKQMNLEMHYDVDCIERITDKDDLNKISEIFEQYVAARKELEEKIKKPYNEIFAKYGY